jgi:SAM-dependent methyltransferase
MRQDDRARFDRALRRARMSAHGPGEFVGQESFMTAGEIRALAERAGVGPGTAVLDLCCGVGGPGRLIARDLRCDYVGVDESASAVAIARAHTNGSGCVFVAGSVPPLPAGSFDVVLLLETMLAFEDKDRLVGGIAARLAPGGRFAFTVEEGAPLSAAERAAMPDADTVWPVPLDELRACLARAGLAIASREDHTAAHRATAQALLGAYAADASAIAAHIGRRALDDLLSAHRLWIEWLETGRVRKLAVVAESAV